MSRIKNKITLQENRKRAFGFLQEAHRNLSKAYRAFIRESDKEGTMVAESISDFGKDLKQLISLSNRLTEMCPDKDKHDHDCEMMGCEDDAMENRKRPVRRESRRPAKRPVRTEAKRAAIAPRKRTESKRPRRTATRIPRKK